MCNSGEIEDEYHFLIICNAYKDIRVKYINKYYYTKPSVMKFVQLVDSNKTSLVYKTCKFIYEAFEYRKVSINRY